MDWKTLTKIVGKKSVAILKQQSEYTGKLKLSRKGKTAEHCKVLATALSKMKALRVLDLGNNQIGDAGLCHFSKMLREMKALKELDLNGNQIGDAGLEHLSKALPEMKALVVLGLSENQVGDEAKSKFIQEWEKAGKSPSNLYI